MYFILEKMLLLQTYTSLSSHAGHGSLPVHELSHSSEAVMSLDSQMLSMLCLHDSGA